MSEPTKLPPSVGRAIPGDFGITRDSLLRQFNIEEPVTGGVDPLADAMLEENDYREAVESLGLPDDPATRLVYTRLRRRLLYEFEYARENELRRPGGDPTTPVRAFEKRVTPRLTIAENRALAKFIREEIEADNIGIYLGDPAAAGPIRHETPLGTKREAGPILDSSPPVEPYQADPIDGLEPRSSTEPLTLRETQLNLSTAAFDMLKVAPHTYSLSIRPGETKTQVIELPGLTLALTITMPSMLPRPV